MSEHRHALVEAILKDNIEREDTTVDAQEESDVGRRSGAKIEHTEVHIKMSLAERYWALTIEREQSAPESSTLRMSGPCLHADHGRKLMRRLLTEGMRAYGLLSPDEYI